MIVIPAVDLRAGRCVRLREGRADQETVFSEDPVAAALRWKACGAERLHVVDLDGAFAGEPRQTALIAAKFSSIRRPQRWLFSGWNCVAWIRPCSTAAAKRTP